MGMMIIGASTVGMPATISVAHSNLEFTTGSGEVYASVEVGSEGTLFTFGPAITGDDMNLFTLPRWCSVNPRYSGAYVIRWSLISGNVYSTNPAAGTWVSTDTFWWLYTSVGGTGAATSTGQALIEIARTSDTSTILASSTVTFTANRV